MSSVDLSHKDYTVGWVCALSKEQTAASAMLDEEHEDLPNPPNDHNAYILGRVGKHNVVMACLPEGEIGTNAAAIVATRMIATFPSIRFGLMVGIGGGVPPKVRLGDVVVSTPVDGFGGVVQWDFGKAEQGDTFKKTGALNLPPAALRTALGKLKTNHEKKGSMIPQYLEDLKTNWPRLAAKYTRSKSLKDVLFKADYNHVAENKIGGWNLMDDVGEDGSETDDDDEDEEEKDCPLCDRTKVVKRKPRGMRIHHGLIASGNQVVKDAAFRDKINERLGGGVLCFEMEAAGLMNDFPCLIIRGICDYADSHKNKAWQEHAAAVAAAFAKEFLLVLQADVVDQLPAIKDILNHVEKISADVAQIKHDVTIAEHERILSWLSLIDPSLNYNKARKRHTPGTGDWFLKGQSYSEWIKGEVSILWLHGIPGCGKTIINSTIIDRLLTDYAQDSKTSIAYFYFDFNDEEKQTVEGCLRSLLRQLSAKDLPPVVKTLFKKTQERSMQPSLSELTDTLKAVLQQASLAFLVFDALDECKEIKDLIKKIAEIKQWELTSVRILATSRRERNIAETMDGLAQAICLQTKLVDEDIKIFIKHNLSSNDLLKQWPADVKKEIQDTLIAGSKGMFRWAECQLYELQKCLRLPMLRKALESLPKKFG